MNKVLVFVLLICCVRSFARSPQGNKSIDRIYIKFIDSDHNKIPYFIETKLYIENQNELSEYDKFTKDSLNSILFPYQQFGLDIWPEKRGFSHRPIIENADMIFKIDRDEIHQSIMDEYPQNKNLQPYFQIMFLDGSTYWISREALSSQKEVAREVEIPGHLGSGIYGDLGRTLANSAYYWYFRKGDKSRLIQDCNRLIFNLKSKNLPGLVSGLIFIREYWLWDHIKPPLWGGVPGGPNEVEAKQLPWEGQKPRYGRFGGDTPILANRAFKYVLSENPSDSRANFFVNILPTVAGFDDPNMDGELSSQRYINACLKIYERNKSRLSDSQKVNFFKVFINELENIVYIERYWNHRKDSKHSDDLNWYILEIKELQSRYSFLRRDPSLYSLKMINYLKDPQLINPPSDER